MLSVLDEPSTDEEEEFDFQVGLRLDQEGNMSFRFDWPHEENVNPRVSAQVLANFLYQLQMGNINTHIVQGLKGYGVKTDTSDMTNLIIHKLMELISTGDEDDIAVRPDEIFRRPI